MKGEGSTGATWGETEPHTVQEAQPVALGARRGRLAGAERTLFGGYGPFVALVALILAMALLAPTIAPERDVTTRPHTTPVAVNERSSAQDGCCR
jgi:hypothetical protein